MHLTVWDEDLDNMIRPRELVDRFHYDYKAGASSGANCPAAMQLVSTGLEAPKST